MLTEMSCWAGAIAIVTSLSRGFERLMFCTKSSAVLHGTAVDNQRRLESEYFGHIQTGIDINFVDVIQ